MSDQAENSDAGDPGPSTPAIAGGTMLIQDQVPRHLNGTVQSGYAARCPARSSTRAAVVRRELPAQPYLAELGIMTWSQRHAQPRAGRLP